MKTIYPSVLYSHFLSLLITGLEFGLFQLKKHFTEWIDVKTGTL